MEWTVVTALVVIVGLFLTVGKPILTLNSNIVELTLTMKEHGEQIKKNAEDLEKHEQHSHDSHKRLWEHNTKQDKQLENHDRRIERLEKK